MAVLIQQFILLQVIREIVGFKLKSHYRLHRWEIVFNCVSVGKSHQAEVQEEVTWQLMTLQLIMPLLALLRLC